MEIDGHPFRPFLPHLPSLRTSILSLGLVFFLAPSSAFACATVRGPSPTAEDYIESEQAVIFWDKDRKIEHFIRQADIQTKDHDLGFLVPTPKVPELVEVDSRIFQLAADVGRSKKVREVIYHTPLQIFGPVLKGPPGIFLLPMVSLLTGMSDRQDSDQLKIVSEQDIAGYHAVVLAANNAPALAEWLKQNNYSWTPKLEAWLTPYVASKWFVTAFKLNKPKTSGLSLGDANQPLVTRAIRMSFATDQPFYPYSEPGAKQKARAASPYGRTLRVAFLSMERMQGTLAGTSSWASNLLFAGSPKPISNTAWTADQWLTFSKLEGQIAMPTTLTYWRDDSNPRPGTIDLYFSPDPDQSSFRKIEIDYSIPPLHWLDLSDPFADIAGFLIALLLPGAPLYCGWRLIRLNRVRTVSSIITLAQSQSHFEIRRILGFFAIVMGVLYFISCIVVAYLLWSAIKALGFDSFPTISNPIFSIATGIFFLTLVHCGVKAFQKEPTADEPYVHRMAFGHYWDYLMAGSSLLIGAGFALAMVAFFISNFFD